MGELLVLEVAAKEGSNSAGRKKGKCRILKKDLVQAQIAELKKGQMLKGDSEAEGGKKQVVRRENS